LTDLESIDQKYNLGKCIACGSHLTEPLVLIGDQYPSAIFLSQETSLHNSLLKSSLDLCSCTNPNCLLVQLKTQIDMGTVYQNYPYESGTTATMKSILANIVDESLNRITLDKNDVVLDIGGNDGSLLHYLGDRNLTRVNIDIAHGINQVFSAKNYFYCNRAFSKEIYLSLNLPKPKLIFSTAVFYQLQNPVQFCRDVFDIMSPNSVFVMQMTYLGSMYKNYIFDNIVHEHAAYYSLFSLEKLLERVGLKVVGAKIVNSYGGSLRVYITRDDSDQHSDTLKFDLDEIRANEIVDEINAYSKLKEFGDNFLSWQSNLKELIQSESKQFGHIFGFGASTKGNMILQALGMTTAIMPEILDNNSKKIGSLTTGTLIPIKDENALGTFPNYVLILPYYYQEFLINLIRTKAKKSQTVRILIPLPVPLITEVTGVLE
jgi:NDP-4-keto-2,6-dideoxyhexose 3-C-methyltransferase